MSFRDSSSPNGHNLASVHVSTESEGNPRIPPVPDVETRRIHPFCASIKCCVHLGSEPFEETKETMATEGKSGAASGGQLEERLDFTKETDLALAQCASLLEDGASVLPDVLAILSALEKKCRIGNDAVNLGRICSAALQACYDVHDHAAVRATLTAYATKRSQKVAAIRALVITAVPWCIATKEEGVTLSYTPIPVQNEEERAHRQALLLALREITDGKLFLERERAQLTRALATIQVGDCYLRI
jgi:hypothetical protein